MATASPGDVSDYFQQLSSWSEAAANVHIFASTPVGPFTIVTASVKVLQGYRPARGWQPVCGRRRHGLFHLPRLCPAYLLPCFASHRTDGQGIRHWFSFLE